MIRILSILLGTCIFISCVHSSKDFPDVEKIGSNYIYTKDLLLGSPTDMLVFDEFLFISDFQPADSATIKIWNFTTGEVVKAAFIGRGPMEVTPPVAMQISGDSLFVFSRGSYRLFSAAVSDVIYESPPKLYHRYDFNYGINRIITINDSICIAAGNYSEGIYAVLHKGKIHKYQGEYPDFWTEEKNISNSVKGIFHQPSLEFNNRNNTVMASGRYTLSLYKLTSDYNMELLSEELLCKYEYDYVDTDNFTQARRKPLSVNGVVSRASNSEHIYLLFDRNLYQSTESEKLDYQIWVYDWKGNRKKTLEISERPSFITVDQDDEYLYGLINLYNGTDSIGVVQYKLK